MSLISITDASKDFGVRTLFKNLELHIKKNERLGLIGPNGSGKSTLLKVIAGLEPLLNGERTCSPALKISLVGQENTLDKNITVMEEVLKGCKKKSDLLIRFRKLTEKISSNSKDKSLLKELGYLSELMDNTNAWNLEQQCKEILRRLGIKDTGRTIKELSGGFQKRVELASALISNPDVLLLDEPTNHLDVSSIQWLQGWLEKYKGALVLITHDRYFLEKVTTRMIEIDNGKIYKYSANYSNYLQLKLVQNTSEKSTNKKFRAILKKELNWLKKGPKARSTKQKARVQRITNLQSQQPLESEKNLELNSISNRIGKKAIDVENLSITINHKKILKDFSYNFTPNDRVGIIGHNGSGKTSLLDVLAGKRKPTSGKIEFGQTIAIGYLDQHTNELSIGKGINRRVIDFIKEAGPIININEKKITASQLLEKFLFHPSEQYSKIEKLSGGEKRRLTLCKMLINAPNILLLDEPTNDLDIQTLSVLEDFLEDFKGCVIIASHDRYFLDRTINKIFNFEQGELKRYDGNYSSFQENKRSNTLRKTLPYESKDYSLNKKSSRKNISLSSEATKKSKNIKELRKISFKEKRELDQLDKEIPMLENRKLEVEKSISENFSDQNVVRLSHELANITEKIKVLEERWLILSDLAK